jgi:hypothetical protein
VWHWVQSHEVLLGWLSAASVLLFVGGMLAAPLLVVRIPADYFLRQQHYTDRWKPRHPLLRIAFLATKNFAGASLVVVGIVLSLPGIPGPGVLTVLLGLMLLDFPGKFALERRLVRLPLVLATINRLRVRAGRKPLEMPQAD